MPLLMPLLMPMPMLLLLLPLLLLLLLWRRRRRRWHAGRMVCWVNVTTCPVCAAVGPVRLLCPAAVLVVVALLLWW